MRLPLRHQILLVTLLPVLLIDGFFTFRHYTNEAEQANEQLVTKAEIISRHLATASELYLFSGDTAQIRRLLEQSIDDNDVTLASVYDSEGSLVAEARSASFDEYDIADYYYKRTAIRQQEPDFDDIFYTEAIDTGSPVEIGWVHLYLSQTALQKAISSALLESLLIFALILVIAAVLSELVSRRISHPISRLLTHVKRVESGELSQRIAEVDNNELGEVQVGFNQMTESLENSQHELNQRIAQATEQLNEAIADLEEKNDELSSARDEAQHANRIKSVFLANMSHEIRTPINGIHGFVGLLAEGKLDDTQKRYVDIIDKSVADLTNIINEILEFSKIESGKLRIVHEVFDLYDVVEQARDILYINTLSKSIECYLIIYADVPRRVIGDKLRLKQILLNLIGNAIKFTDSGKITIKMSVVDESTDETDILISVEDTGIGISEDDQHHLFEAFTQVENEENRRFQGTGLGLVISQNLASLLGGKISLKSELDKGSTFDVLLPMRKVDSTASNQPADIELSALAIAGGKTGLMEIASLLNRNGIVTETGLVDGPDQANLIKQTLENSLPLVDLVLIDNREMGIDPTTIITDSMLQQAKFIMLDRSSENLLSDIDNKIERVPVTISSQEFLQLLQNETTSHVTQYMPRPHEERPPQRVLLVDDNLVNLTLGEELLKNWGHLVTAESHSNKALELFKQQDFDFIILDIQMPEIDGITLMRQMRKFKPHSDSRYIAMTATVADEIDNQFIDSGFDYYIAKPIDRERFKNIVDGTEFDISGDTESGSPADNRESFDYDGSLMLSANKPELLKKILQMLLRDFPEFRQKLKQFQQSRDVSQLGPVVHKIHGVTCYCSLPKLRSMVSGVETRIVDMEEVELMELTEQLWHELQTVETEVNNCLQRMVA